MQTKIYYQKIKHLEATLPDGDVVIVSNETPDGGKAGVMVETPRSTAARLIVEGKARLASEEEAKRFRESLAESYRAAQQAAAAQRIQVTMISEAELKALRSAARISKQ